MEIFCVIVALALQFESSRNDTALTESFKVVGNIDKYLEIYAYTRDRGYKSLEARSFDILSTE